MTDHANIQHALSLRRILYCSVGTVPAETADLTGILIQSKHNNAINGVSGILWSDGLKFIQVFEGPMESVGVTWDRIRTDPRHCEINVIQDSPVEKREFGYWTMVHRQHGEPTDHHDWHVQQLLSEAPPAVAAPFLAMLGLPDQ
ncbi:BLUF domain-containing protein [Sphingobium boeckii]|uniref:BLUF domain-containing protein n=1 Tax=Sphingobium boeckii TaxID=1082345 RepID=A0A7W9EDG9_9SPHN|nr:BLUF domain-containing protein [Sphingobium boeckii]MBB5684919.1 hypothetical protein [Sphingobium boeckii]